MSAVNCECGCHEVHIISKHQPNVMLFREYTEMHLVDFLKIRSLLETFKKKVEDARKKEEKE